MKPLALTNKQLNHQASKIPRKAHQGRAILTIVIVAKWFFLVRFSWCLGALVVKMTFAVVNCHTGRIQVSDVK